jgi:hypothetical protein
MEEEKDFATNGDWRGKYKERGLLRNSGSMITQPHLCHNLEGHVGDSLPLALVFFNSLPLALVCFKSLPLALVFFNSLPLALVFF